MLGVFLAVGAAFFSSGKDVVSKRLSRNLTALVSGFTSFAYAIPFYLVFVPLAIVLGLEDLSFTIAFLGWLVLRALSDCGAELCKMRAIQDGDLSLVSSFLSLSPILLVFLAPVLTGDSITWVGIVAVVLTTLGALSLVFDRRVFKSKLSMKAIGFALLSSVCFALNSCFDRLAVQSGGPILAAFSVTVFAAVLTWPLACRRLSAELPGQQKPLLLRGGFELVFMCLKLWALVYLPPQYVVALGKVSIVCSVVAGRVIYNEPALGRRLFASAFVVIGAALIAFEELVLSL